MSKPWCSIFLFYFKFIQSLSYILQYKICHNINKNLFLFLCFSLLHLFIFFVNIVRFFISFFHQMSKVNDILQPYNSQGNLCVPVKRSNRKKNSSSLAVFKGLNDMFSWMEERLRDAPFFLGASLGSRVPRVNRRWWAQGVTRHATHQRNRSHCLRVQP